MKYEADVFLGGFLCHGQQNRLDVRQRWSIHPGAATGSCMEVTGDDTGLLVVTGSVSSQLQDLSMYGHSCLYAAACGHIVI